MTPGRRTLRFHSLDEIMPEVERLLAGCETVGNWSLGQICRHLATALRGSADSPATAGRDPSKYAGPENKRRFFEAGVVEEGRPIPRGLRIPETLDDHHEADGLRDAIAHYASSPCPVVDHPLLGPLTHDEWNQFHCIHAAHHLSFALPVGS